MDKCVCHINGYKVKDSKARETLSEHSEKLTEHSEKLTEHSETLSNHQVCIVNADTMLAQHREAIENHIKELSNLDTLTLNQMDTCTNRYNILKNRIDNLPAWEKVTLPAIGIVSVSECVKGYKKGLLDVICIDNYIKGYDGVATKELRDVGFYFDENDMFIIGAFGHCNAKRNNNGTGTYTWEEHVDCSTYQVFNGGDYMESDYDVYIRVTPLEV